MPNYFINGFDQYLSKKSNLITDTLKGLWNSPVNPINWKNMFFPNSKKLEELLKDKTYGPIVAGRERLGKLKGATGMAALGGLGLYGLPFAKEKLDLLQQSGLNKFQNEQLMQFLRENHPGMFRK